MTFAHLPAALPDWSELPARVLAIMERHLVVLLAAALLISSGLLAATIDLKRTIMGRAPLVVPPTTEQMAVPVDPFYDNKRLAPTEELPAQF